MCPILAKWYATKVIDMHSNNCDSQWIPICLWCEAKKYGNEASSFVSCIFDYLIISSFSQWYLCFFFSYLENQVMLKQVNIIFTNGCSQKFDSIHFGNNIYGWGQECAVFLNKTLNSHSTSLHTILWMGSGKFNFQEKRFDGPGHYAGGKRNTGTPSNIMVWKVKF